jgi:chromosome segregation ATPase
MMQQIQAEIEAIRSQIEALQQERASLQVNNPSPEDESPQAIADMYRRHARETAQLSAEVKGIDDAISALATQLNQKQAQLEALQNKSPQKSLQQQVEEGRQRAKVHAERINQLAAELADELRSLKDAADELSPKYWQVYYKPFITGFQTISVPHVRSDGDVWTIVNRVV